VSRLVPVGRPVLLAEHVITALGSLMAGPAPGLGLLESDPAPRMHAQSKGVLVVGDLRPPNELRVPLADLLADVDEEEQRPARHRREGPARIGPALPVMLAVNKRPDGREPDR
jgi:hypothetical protein